MKINELLFEAASLINQFKKIDPTIIPYLKIIHRDFRLPAESKVIDRSDWRLSDFAEDSYIIKFQSGKVIFHLPNDRNNFIRFIDEEPDFVDINANPHSLTNSFGVMERFWWLEVPTNDEEKSRRRDSADFRIDNANYDVRFKKIVRNPAFINSFMRKLKVRFSRVFRNRPDLEALMNFADDIRIMMHGGAIVHEKSYEMHQLLKRHVDRGQYSRPTTTTIKLSNFTNSLLDDLCKFVEENPDLSDIYAN